MKIYKRILIALLVLIIPLTVIGCAKAKDNNKLIIGKYSYADAEVLVTTDKGIESKATLDSIIDTAVDLNVLSSQNKYALKLYLGLLRVKFNDDNSFDIGFEMSTSYGNNLSVGNVYISDIIKDAVGSYKFNLADYLSYSIEDNKMFFKVNISDELMDYIYYYFEDVIAEYGPIDGTVIFLILSEVFKDGVDMQIDNDYLTLLPVIDANEVIEILESNDLYDQSEFTQYLEQVNELKVTLKLAKMK